MFSAAIQRCRQIRLELPAEKELQRLVFSAWQQYLNINCQKIADRLAPEQRNKMDQCLNAGANEKDRYEWIKGTPGKFGVKSILAEIDRLRFVNSFGIKADEHLKDIPDEILKLLRERAAPEGAFQIKRHPLDFRYALLAALFHFRRMELTDNIVDIFLELIHRIEKKADKKLERELVSNIRAVYKKGEILYKLAKASTQNPKDTVENVVFSAVGEDVLNRIIMEYEGKDLSYESNQNKEKKDRYTHSSRRMTKPVLDTLTFRTNNPVRQPIIKGIEIVRKYLDKKHTWIPEEEEVPDELLTEFQNEMTTDNDEDSRIIKHYFELYVLQKLEKALRNKEIWVEDSYRYRNPDQDLPRDWTIKWESYCDKHRIPQRSENFINPIREELASALEKANEFFSRKQDVYIYFPGKSEKGLFSIPKIVQGQERPILQEIKQKAIDRWGVLDLVDILLEADRQVNFTRFFYSTAQRQILDQNEIRERLLLSILGRGTGLGLKRIHAAAKPNYSYEDLIYFNRRFIHLDSVREAIAALVNRIIEVRSPEIWRNTTACTSDGKYIGAWEQNLAARWNPHYQECGIMMYSMVDTNSAGIHSQIRRGTEVAAMITALLRHDTVMSVESNSVDSHGQSELGLAFCRFLSVELLPWLKRMKHERLYLPDIEMKSRFPHLAGVLGRPIQWHHAHENYSDMARHVVAAKEHTAPIDSLLRRFNRNNPANQTYKGFLEIGKAIKTIHDCKFLTDPSYRQRIHAERNVAESWNSAIDFICYGGKSEIQTNDLIIQELTVLCLHLLQNALVLVNTVMMERILRDADYINRIQAEDKDAMTPLFTSNVNPYGDIHLDINKPSFLEMH
jgi:TnpA family transposase